MNERIVKLAEQCGFIHENLTSSERFDALRKFESITKFIVGECSSLLFDEADRLSAHSMECDNMRESVDAELLSEHCVELITTIEKHFGVE